MARQDPEQLTEHIVRAIIGDGQLHQAQRDILDNLAAGRSVLGVMVTGRGKSLTFQVHATLRALAAHEASLFVYPLRALIADQAFHLRRGAGALRHRPWLRLRANPRWTNAGRRSRAWPTAASTSR